MGSAVRPSLVRTQQVLPNSTALFPLSSGRYLALDFLVVLPLNQAIFSPRSIIKVLKLLL